MSEIVVEDPDGSQCDEFADEVRKDDNTTTDDLQFDPELEAIKERFKELEADATKLHDLRATVDRSPVTKSNTSTLSEDEKAEVDLRSIYVGNVDYGSAAEELEAHFRGCGAINRVTIQCNMFTGQPKGFAYVEFESRDAVEAAMALDESSFRSRLLKVLPKRTNVPGMSMTNRPRGRFRPRGAGFRGAFGGGYGGGYGGGRPRFARYRRRSSYHFSPY